MGKGREEPVVEIRSILIWQLAAVFMCSVVAEFVAAGFFSVMLGGLLVAGSTWHLHKNVARANGDRVHLMRSAGLRFFVLLVLMAFVLLVLDVRPMQFVIGMGLAYTVLYVRSLILIFGKMKGDSLG